jgi:hypothetical protein
MSENTGRIDIGELKRRVSLLELVKEVVTLKPHGNELKGLCPFHNEKTPSFGIPKGKAYYHCFGCGAHGDAIKFVEEYQKVSFMEAVRYLARRVGLEPVSEPVHKLAPRAPAEPEADDSEEETDRIVAAQNIWKQSRPGAGTLVELYLQGRGIDILRLGGVPPTLRFHPSLYHSDSQKYFPAMVGAIQGPDRSIIGVHRTFLVQKSADHYPKQQNAMAAIMGIEDADKMRLVPTVVVKAPISKAKKMKGTSRGGCVRLCQAAQILCIAEGIETAFSVRQATGMATWAALSLGNMGAIKLPVEVDEVVLCSDNDAKDPQKAEVLLQRQADAIQRQRKIVRIARPVRGADFNDMLSSTFKGGNNAENSAAAD